MVLFHPAHFINFGNFSQFFDFYSNKIRKIPTCTALFHPAHFINFEEFSSLHVYSILHDYMIDQSSTPMESNDLCFEVSCRDCHCSAFHTLSKNHFITYIIEGLVDRFTNDHHLQKSLQFITGPAEGTKFQGGQYLEALIGLRVQLIPIIMNLEKYKVV